MTKKPHSIDKKGLRFVLQIMLTLLLFAGVVQLFEQTTSIAIQKIYDSSESERVLSYLLENRSQLASPTSATETANVDLYNPPAEVVEHIPDTQSFLLADLHSMVLQLYEDGKLFKNYSIISKGKSESQWQNINKQYTVLQKSTNHFSPAEKVYMPYNIQFDKNLFIHGQLRHPDGTHVDRGYSRGYIQLHTEDARSLYERVETNTPVYIYYPQAGAGSDSSGTSEALPKPTEVSAKAYLVADVETGEVFLQHNTREQLPIASITKLMTAIVANEVVDNQKIVPISAHAINTYGTAGGLRLGESMTLEELFYPLLLESSNDAATAIAEFYGEAPFMDLMNRTAYALKMSDTHYADPSGLSAKNTSTATDLFTLARYIHTNKRHIFDFTMLNDKNIVATGSGDSHVFRNNNPFRRDEFFIGGKNGYTDEAKFTLLSLFKIPVNGRDRVISIIVLGSNDYTQDTWTLRKWLGDNLNGTKENTSPPSLQRS